jgi:hypothetical protein
MMNRPKRFAERRKYPRFPVSLPIEYWERGDSVRRGGLAGDISEMGLLILSTQKMGIGTKLRIKLLFPDGYELTDFEVLGKIVWKSVHSDMDWSGYKYGAKFIRISDKDRTKLERFLLANLSIHLSMKEISEGNQDSYIPLSLLPSCQNPINS